MLSSPPPPPCCTVQGWPYKHVKHRSDAALECELVGSMRKPIFSSFIGGSFPISTPARESWADEICRRFVFFIETNPVALFRCKNCLKRFIFIWTVWNQTFIWKELWKKLQETCTAKSVISCWELIPGIFFCLFGSNFGNHFFLRKCWGERDVAVERLDLLIFESTFWGLSSLIEKKKIRHMIYYLHNLLLYWSFCTRFCTGNEEGNLSRKS